MELLSAAVCFLVWVFYGDCEAHTFFWLAELTETMAGLFCLFHTMCWRMIKKVENVVQLCPGMWEQPLGA